jgi:hypothetical protein
MGTNKITGLGTPTTSTDASTKAYVDTMLPLAGGTMSGAIAMGTNKITGVGDPTNAQDVVTKYYLDNVVLAPSNLTGPITSTGSATAIASQTGTGTKFVMDNTPTLITPVLGVATATSINGTTIPSSKTLVATDSTQYVVPSQSGNSGKYLTTDGTTSSWGTVATGVSTSGGDTITVASGTTVPLTIQNNGTGNSFVVNDVASDTTPFVVTADGNVGINTASLTTAGGYGSITIDGSTGSLWSAKVAGTETFRIQPTAASTTVNGIANVPILINTNNTERMRVNSDGNVGIGTSSPGADLHIGSSTTVSDMRMGNSAASTVLNMYTTSNEMVIYNATATGSLQLGTNNGTDLTIDSSGNTTINTIAAGTTSTAAVGGGYMGLPQNSTTTGAYTIAAADAGKHIYSTATRTITIDSNANLALPVGTTVSFVAGTGATVTIAITTDTMYLAGPGTTGSRTLAAFGIATAVKIASTTWIISGNGLT